MNHYLLIPPEHPQQHLLGKLCEQLLEAINADSIYLSLGNDQPIPEIIFTIFIDTTFTRLDNELLLPVERIFNDHSSMACRLFSCDYAEDALRKGNLYFLNHCTLGEKVYSNPSSSHTVHAEAALPNVLLPRAKKHFKSRIGKIEGRYTNFPKCLKYEKFIDAAYTLHQMLEQLFKAAELFLIGKEVFSKDMLEHQDAIRRFAPSLGTLFNTADEEEDRLQKLLYATYVAYRKNERLDISRSDVEKLLSKTQFAKQEVERLFKESALLCFKKAALENEEIEAEELPAEKVTLVLNTVSAPNSLQDTIVEIIRQSISTVGVYCFGERKVSGASGNSIFSTTDAHSEKVHYYILAITNENKNNAISDISDAIFKSSGGTCSVTLLLHKATSLSSITPHSKYFFYQVMKKGYRWFEHNVVQATITFDGEPQRNTDVIRSYWDSRKTVSIVYLEAENQIEGYERELVRESLLHIAIEQTCLGLIEVFLGYRPLHYHLGYLFDLCELFCPLTTEIFPRNSDEDKRIFDLLCTKIHTLRIKTLNFMDYLPVEILERRCNLFHEKAVALIKNELERLDKLYK